MTTATAVKNQTANTRTFEYGYANVRDLQLEGKRRDKTRRMDVESVGLKDQKAAPTRRFWRSFFARFNISDTVFRYFEPDEVLERIADRNSDASFRYCIEKNSNGKSRLLAVSNPSRPVIQYDEITRLSKKYGGEEEIKYSEGVVTSTHTPRSGGRTFQIGGDQFQHRFVMETPVDGFSHPKIYLSFLRMICSNGAIGYSKAFRSDISLGKNMSLCISRALDSYDNGDGYAALRQRFESAQNSWASVHECMKLYKSLTKLEEIKVGSTLLKDFHKMTGNLNSLYGLANLDALSVKRQRVLPSKCRVYDLINFASEVATHYASDHGNRVMQAYIGSLISDEYDMEGTAGAANEFDDFFVQEESVGSQLSLN